MLALCREFSQGRAVLKNESAQSAYLALQFLTLIIKQVNDIDK